MHSHSARLKTSAMPLNSFNTVMNVARAIVRRYYS